MSRPLTSLFSCVLAGFWLASTVRAATSVRRDPQALALAGQAAQALTGKTTLTDATFQGTVNFTAGGDEESGSFSLELKGDLESKLVLGLSGGTREEVRQYQSGDWLSADGQEHTMAYHNCLVDADWLLPVFTLQAAIADQTMSALYLGQTTVGGAVADHLQFSHPVSVSSNTVAAELQELSALDVFLDGSSHLPLATAFNRHPDGDATVNAAVQIAFSGYERVGGAVLPSQVQESIQGTPVFQFTLGSVALNSGIPDSDFATQ